MIGDFSDAFKTVFTRRGFSRGLGLRGNLLIPHSAQGGARWSQPGLEPPGPICSGWMARDNHIHASQASAIGRHGQCGKPRFPQAGTGCAGSLISVMSQYSPGRAFCQLQWAPASSPHSPSCFPAGPWPHPLHLHPAHRIRAVSGCQPQGRSFWKFLDAVCSPGPFLFPLSAFKILLLLSWLTLWAPPPGSLSGLFRPPSGRAARALNS